MSKITKYVTATIIIIIVAYVGWLVINSTFKLEKWFEQNPMWKDICTLLLIIGIIGFIAGIVEAKR